MRELLDDYLYGLLLLVCVVGTVLATLAFLAPAILPEPFATAAARSNLWIVATASLTILGMLFALLAMRWYLV
jgi:hypothetical protein